MPKRILSIICLTNAICKHKGLLFKLISTHTFNIHSTNTHACCGSDTVLYIIPLSCFWTEDNFSSQRISRQLGKKILIWIQEMKKCTWKLQSVTFSPISFHVILHTYSSLGKHVKITSKTEWPGKLTFPSLSVTDVNTPCYFSILTVCYFLLRHIYVPEKSF